MDHRSTDRRSVTSRIRKVLFLKKNRTVPDRDGTGVENTDHKFGSGPDYFSSDQNSGPRSGPFIFGPRTGAKLPTTVPIRTGTVILSGPLIHVMDRSLLNRLILTNKKRSF